MIGVLPTSSQLPAFALKAKAKDSPSVMGRRCVPGREEKITIKRKPFPFDTSSLYYSLKGVIS